MSIRTAADVFAHRLPKTIRAFQARVAIHPELWSLPSSALRLVQIIATYSPLTSLDRPVIFSRKRPAELLGVSVRTIDRRLNDLVEFGLIVRVRQRRSDNGIWDCTAIRWTDAAKRYFFKPLISSPTAEGNVINANLASGYGSSITNTAPQLDAAVSRAGTAASAQPPAYEHALDATPPGNEHHRATDMAHKTTPAGKPEVFIKKKSEAERFSKQPSPRKPPVVRYQGRSIRSDLVQYAQSLELSGKDVVHLLARCRDAKQKLQDILALQVAYMLKRSIKGREAIAWITSQLATGRDFGWVLRLKEQDAKRDVQQRKRGRIVARMVEALRSRAGCILPNGAVLEEVKGDLAYVSLSGRRASLPVHELAEKVLRRYSAWSRRCLRGQLLEDRLQVAVEISAPTPVTANRKDHGGASLRAVQALAAAKAIVGLRGASPTSVRGFQQSRYV
jgi:hypothetical protein